MATSNRLGAVRTSPYSFAAAGRNDYSAAETAMVQFSGAYERSATVVVTYHNGPWMLASLLGSLAVQSYPAHLLEVIIVDDGSEPALTEEGLPGALASRSSIVRIEHHGYRLSTMRNAGILQGSGEVVLCLDQDIICPPNWLEAHMRWFHVTDRIATFGLRRFVDTYQAGDAKPISYETANQLPEIKSNSNGFLLGDKRLIELSFLKDHPFPFNCFYGCNIAFERRAALDVGMFDEAYNLGFGYEDLDFGLRLWNNGCQIAHVAAATVIHQENSAFSIEFKVARGVENRRRLYERAPGLEEFRQALRGCD